MTSFRFNKGWRNDTVFSTLIFMLLLGLYSQLSYAVVDGWEDVSGVTIEQSSRFYDRQKREYYTINTVKKDPGSDIAGPLRLVVTDSSHPVTNEDGTDGSLPYFNILSNGSEEAIRINFQRIRASFAYTVVVQQLIQDIPVDSDGDGIPDTEDSCPLDLGVDEDGDGICGIADTCPLDPGIDEDEDGICGVADTCPLDPGVDEDGDGICGLADTCPLDPGVDEDNDGICGLADTCPLDPGVDEDNDGICGLADTCPLDPGNDVDADGICALDDFCPEDASNSCVTIVGQVFSDGSSLQGASIKIGLNSVHTSTDIAGSFSANTGPAEISNDGLNDFFPIEVSAPGYATSNAKVTVKPGQFNYEVTIAIKPVSDTIAVEDDLTQGVEIIKEGNPVGQITIPDAALPAGVTGVTGTVTYLDPTTDDILAAPGGDLLALPEGSDPNVDSPVPLESFGMMEFDLKDQNGGEVHLLEAPAEVCMQATSGLGLGDIVPLWYYDESKGLWIEEGQGTVVTRVVNGNDQLMICGEVSHFTWWNYDQPIDSHSCFKYHFVFETNSTDLSGLEWKAEGVSYNGTSPERDCNRDSNDPEPNSGDPIDSVTVKRTTESANPEQIRMFAMIGGAKFYLLRDGDGTYSLTQDQSAATVFDTPEANGSCLNNTNVDQCQFLDYLDNEADGILPLSTDVNLPPLISEFSVNLTHITPGTDVAVSAVVTDPEGADVSLDWTTECGYYYSTTDNGVISPTNDSGVSGSVFLANYTAPTTLSYPIESCRITLTATDATGAFSSADKWITVAGSFQYVFEGILYGTDGLPMTETPINYSNFGGCSAEQFITTDLDGYYHVEIDLASCAENGQNEGGFIDLGSLYVEYSYNGLYWSHDEYINGYGELQNNICTVEQDASTLCNIDIHLPTLWGPLGGNIYHPATGELTNMNISSYSFNSNGYGGYGYDSLNWLPINPGSDSYGPILVPLGEGNITAYDDSFNNYSNANYTIPSTDGVNQDVGEASAPVTVTVFDDQGQPLVGVGLSITNYPQNGSGSVEYTGVTNGDGQYTELAVSMGYLYVRTTSSPFYYRNTSVSIKDQPVYIDFNSTETCTVTGTFFDQFGQPMPENEMIELYNDGDSNFGSFLSTTTNESGEFSIPGVTPGYVYFSENYYSGYQYIDNCRPMNGSPRVIRKDRGFIDDFNGFIGEPI